MFQPIGVRVERFLELYAMKERECLNILWQREKWLEKLNETRKELYGEISTYQDENKKLGSQKKELIRSIRSELEKVEDVFKETGILEEVPKVRLTNKNGISLNFPIVRHTTHYGSFIDFKLELVENGFGVRVKYNGHNEFIAPPIEVQRIREKILEYLEQRRAQIKKIEKKY